MEFSANSVLGVFESDASFIFWKRSMNGSKMTQQGVKGYHSNRRNRIFIDSLYLCEVSHISLHNVFGSLPTTRPRIVVNEFIMVTKS